MTYIARLQYTNQEVTLLARLMQAEALGEGDQGMLLVGNVVINRVVTKCDVFRNVRTITDAIYQENAFAGVGTDLFNSPVSSTVISLARRCIDGYRSEPAYNALWFKNPGQGINCPSQFYGNFSGRFKNHCFYNPTDSLNCTF